MVTAYTFQNILKRILSQLMIIKLKHKPYTQMAYLENHKQKQRMRERMVGGKGKS